MIIFHLTLGNKSKGHFMNKSLLLVHNKNAAEVLTWLPGPQWTCRWIWRYSFRISKLDLDTIMIMLIMAHSIFTKYPFRIHHSTSPLTWRPCRPGPRWTCAACPRCWGRWCSHSGRRPCSDESRVSSPGHQKDISTYVASCMFQEDQTKPAAGCYNTHGCCCCALLWGAEFSPVSRKLKISNPPPTRKVDIPGTCGSSPSIHEG